MPYAFSLQNQKVITIVTVRQLQDVDCFAL